MCQTTQSFLDISSSSLQVRKLRYRMVKWLSQGRTVADRDGIPASVGLYFDEINSKITDLFKL